MKTRQTVFPLFFAILIGVLSFGLSEAAEVTLIPRTPSVNLSSILDLLDSVVIKPVNFDEVAFTLPDSVSGSDVIIETSSMKFRPTYKRVDGHMYTLLWSSESLILEEKYWFIKLGPRLLDISIRVKLEVDLSSLAGNSDSLERAQFVSDMVLAMYKGRAIKFHGYLVIDTLPKGTDFLETHGVTIWLKADKVEF